ncbi:30S ribosomal protein S20 [bacterium]|nr:30S ribosomal protein S20 [bacterium]
MANHKSAIKRIKQNAKRRARNIYYKSTVKTYEKMFYSAIDEKKSLEEIMKLYKQLVSYYDRIADKGIIHRNKAARKISRFSQLINELSKASGK